MSWLLLIPATGFAYYLVYNLRTAWYLPLVNARLPLKSEAHLPSVAVIVPARNESLNIGNCLASLLAQDYPAAKREIIVVDDHSTDDTVEKAEFYLAADAASRVIRLAEGKSGKKAGISRGIAAASAEIIMTTDADCVSGPEWLRTMASAFDDETHVVSGPVKLNYRKTFFERMQALEFSGLIATGAAAIAAGAPTLANGANFAYKKSAFESLGGFGEDEKHPSGDDEFLLHRIHQKYRTGIRFAADRRAIVSTPAAKSWQAFRAQRIRWVSKSTAYQRKGITFSLALCWLGMWIIPSLAITTLAGISSAWLLPAVIGLKMLSEAAVLFPATRFFGNSSLLLLLPAETLLHTLYVIWVGIAGNFSKYEWKGRLLNAWR